MYVGFGVVANDPNLNDVLWTDFSNSQNEPGMTNYCAEGPLVQPFTVAASNVARVTIPIYIMAFDPNAVEQGHGINVAASAPVSVYALDYYPAASAAFTVYPTALLGTNYRVMSRAAFDTTDGGYSEFAIVATESNTTVRITPSPAADFSGIMGTGTFSNILEQGQTYLMRSSNAVDDVTGTLVTSDRPIAVFAGASSAYVPDANTQTANPLMQEQIPVEDWGTNVLALSFAGRSNGDTYRVLACQDGTVVTVTGTILTSTNETSPPWTVTTSNETVTFMTNSGEFFDIGVDGPVQFQSTKPIQVAQFANGTDFDALPRGEGDPCEVLLAPTDHYLQTNIIFTLGTNVGDFDENYINVIVPQLAVSSVLFDGSDIPATNFGRIGTSGYYGAQLSLTNSGTHKLTGPQPIGIQAYGWAPQDAYNYLGGIVK